jgi:serine protease Do
MKKIFSKKVLGYIALALVCTLAGTALGMTRNAQAAETVVVTSPFTEAIAKVRDSVVGVYNYQLVNTYPNGSFGGYGNYGGYGLNPWDIFGDYFGYGYGNGGNGYGNGGNGNGYGNGGQQEKEVKYASGSGVVVAKEYVLTNYHVIDGSSSLKISIGGDDSNLYEASVAASDADKDLAVLYVPGLPLEPVEIGDSDQLVVGDWAINIGNAIGFTGTVTAGIISALDREIESDTATQKDRYGRKSAVVNTMIQTDAAINSGNSGGGMFNTAGQLVGIPTLKYSGTRYSSSATVESIGMCIPINEAKEIINEALNNKGSEEPAEQVTDGKDETTGGLTGKPRMGVTVSTVKDTKGQLPRGAYINSVDEGSPAEAAGLKVGDIMVEVNGQVITTVTEEIEIISKLKEGDEVAVKVFRPASVTEDGRVSYEGKYIDLTVKLAVVDEVSQ